MSHTTCEQCGALGTRIHPDAPWFCPRCAKLKRQAFAFERTSARAALLFVLLLLAAVYVLAALMPSCEGPRNKSYSAPEVKAEAENIATEEARRLGLEGAIAVCSWNVGLVTYTCQVAHGAPRRFEVWLCWMPENVKQCERLSRGDEL